MTVLTSHQLDVVRERTARERREQRLPATVTDPSTLAKVARIVAGAKNADRGSLRSTSGQGGSPAATSEDAA